MATKTEEREAIIKDAMGRLGVLVDAETAAIQKARKAAIPSHLERRDELQGLIRSLREAL